MRKMKWKPCPFCGETEFDITTEDKYLEHGGECLHLTCQTCDTDVWFFVRSNHNVDYDTALARLNLKWNTRYCEGGEEE